MSSTYSPNLAIELIGTGDQAGAWGNTTNTNLGTLIEQAISGYVTQAVSTGATTTITIPNGATGVARNMYIELTGTGGVNTFLEVPSNKKLYFIYNNSSGAVTVRVSGQTGVAVAVGEKKILASNGTDVVEATTYIISGGSGNLTTLSVTSANITTLTGTTFGDTGTTNLRGVSGNITTLTGSTFGTTATTQLRGASANITIATLGAATVTTLAATSGSVTNLTVASATVTALSATSGSVTNLTVTSATVTTLGATSASITTLSSTSGTITTLSATSGTVTTLSSTSANITTISSTNVTATSLTLTNALKIGQGGTGLSSTPSNGQLLIGNGTGYTLATLTAGTGISLTNSAGSITISGGSSLTGITTSTATALGLNAGDSVTTGYDNTCIGYDAGTAITTGYDNTVVGHQAGDSILGGYENTCVGSTAGYGVTSGYQNTLLGYGAGDVVTSGNSNVFIGRWAGIDITTGSNNTGVGTVAMASAFVNASNSSALGYNANITGSDQVQLGNSSTTTYAYGAVQDRSDIRDKTEVRDTQLGLNFIMALRPRDFKWDMREDYRTERPDRKNYQSDADYEAALSAWKEANKLANITHDGTHVRTRYHHGLIAQEVKATIDAMGIDFGGYQDHTIKGGDDVKSIGYNELVGPLIKAIQELKAEFDEYKRTHP